MESRSIILSDLKRDEKPEDSEAVPVGELELLENGDVLLGWSGKTYLREEILTSDPLDKSLVDESSYGKAEELGRGSAVSKFDALLQYLLSNSAVHAGGGTTAKLICWGSSLSALGSAAMGVPSGWTLRMCRFRGKIFLRDPFCFGDAPRWSPVRRNFLNYVTTDKDPYGSWRRYPEPNASTGRSLPSPVMRRCRVYVRMLGDLEVLYGFESDCVGRDGGSVNVVVSENGLFDVMPHRAFSTLCDSKMTVVGDFDNRRGVLTAVKALSNAELDKILAGPAYSTLTPFSESVFLGRLQALLSEILKAMESAADLDTYELHYRPHIEGIRCCPATLEGPPILNKDFVQRFR